MLLCFFFSSRRRHTRSKRDWSSDVCSSDLFKRADIYSLSLGLALPAVTSVAVLILLSIGHNLTSIVLFFLMAVLLYFSAFNIRRLSVNTDWKKWAVTAVLIIINFVSLMLVLIQPYLITLGLLFIIIFTVIMKK